ncbi:MAG: helix-turn-helix domain-containing protein [Actinomycetota bacterium]
MSPRRPVALPGADKDAVRRHLVDAAAAVLRRRRTASVTVREIASEAGVASGLLYNHFADKAELIAAAVIERGPAFAADDTGPLSRPGESTVADNLHGYATQAMEAVRDVLPVILTAPPELIHRIAAAVHAGSNPHLAARSHLSRYLRAEQQLGRVRADADADIAALLIVGALHELVIFANLGGPTEDDAVMLRRIVDAVTRSIT